MGIAEWRIFRIKNRAPKWRVIGHSFLAFLENDLTTSAAAISYYVMLMLFPLLVVLVSVGQTIVGAQELRRFLIDQVLALLPGTQQFVRENLESGTAGIAPGAVFSCVIIIFWAASWIFTVIERALNRIWMTPARSFLHGRLLTTGMIGASGMFLLLSALLAASVAMLQTFSERVQLHVPIAFGPYLGVAWQLAFAATSLVVSICLFMLIYKIMPNTKVYWIEAVPGALICGVAWEVLKYGFAYLLPRFLEEYRVLYGGIWLALVLLTWVYMSSIVMLFGAQLTALLHCERVFSREPSNSSYSMDREPAVVRE